MITTQEQLKTATTNHMNKPNTGNDSSPHILIVGPSGSGKSRSIKNLPKQHTRIINVESKILPFVEHKEFKDSGCILGGFTSIAQIDNEIKKLKSDPNIQYIVMDSFGKYLELLMAESRQIQKGYEIFNYYNTAIFNSLEAWKKNTNQIMIFLGADELIKAELPSGATTNKRCFSCEGKVHLSKIEKEFSIVLFTDVSVEPGSKPPKVNYRFATQTDGVTTAKSPEGMFSYYIENDLLQVVNAVEKYFGITKPTTPC